MSNEPWIVYLLNEVYVCWEGNDTQQKKLLTDAEVDAYHNLLHNKASLEQQFLRRLIK